MITENELTPQTIDQLPAAEDVRIWIHEIRKGMASARYYLLKVRDTQGWLALGYASFEDLAQQELGLTRQHAHRLANAAQAELVLELSSPIGDKNPVPESQLRPLVGLGPDQAKAAWAEANDQAQAAGEKLTAKMVQEAVDRATAKLQTKLREEQEMANALRQQRDRMTGDLQARVDVLENALVQERQDKAEKVKQGAVELAEGELQKRQELLARNEAHLEKLRRELHQIENRSRLVLASEAAADSIKKHLMGISADVAVFADEFSESCENKAMPNIADWERLVKSYIDGVQVMNGLLEQLKAADSINA